MRTRVFDRVVELDAAAIKPQVTWGTSPEMVTTIDGRVPDPAEAAERGQAARLDACAGIHGLAGGYAD